MCRRRLHRQACIAAALFASLCAGQCPPPNLPPDPPPEGMPEWDPAAYPWPMFGQNPRRSARSPFVGPASADDAGGGNWSYQAVGGASINMQAVVDSSGVYFGTWGVLRREGGLITTRTPDQWDKSDGRYYGLHLDRRAGAAAQEIFDPLLPANTPVGYLRPGRAKLQRDEFWTGADNDYLVSFYNGTIEGTACIDPADGTHYVGRGDGRLFAIDPVAGEVRWVFQTFNPEDPDDPDGGGEVIGGPLLGPGWIIYFATFGAPWPESLPDEPCYETHAIYAVDADGELVWRYPSQAARLSNFLSAPPVLSPDGETLYLATQAGDVTVPGELFALDLTAAADAPDDARLKWKLTLENAARVDSPHVYVHRMACDPAGRLYGVGGEVQFLGSAPVAFAVDDLGTSGRLAWTPHYVELQGYPSTQGQIGSGLALDETADAAVTLFIGTTHVGRLNGDGGELLALDPDNGQILHRWDPSDDTGGRGGLTPPIVDAAGRVYVGQRGRTAGLLDPAVNGRMYGVDYGPVQGFSLVWDFEADGQLDWAAPVIGADGGLYFGTTDSFNALQHLLYYDPDQVPPDTSPWFYAIFD